MEELPSIESIDDYLYFLNNKVIPDIIIYLARPVRSNSILKRMKAYLTDRINELEEYGYISSEIFLNQLEILSEAIEGILFHRNNSKDSLNSTL